VRQLGNEIVHGWAQRQHQKKETEYLQRPDVNPKEKNLYWFTVFGKIEIKELVFRQGRTGPVLRPFKKSARVECRGYSHWLQRAMVGFWSG